MIRLTLLLLATACSPPSAPGCVERLPDGRYLLHSDVQSVRGWCPTVPELLVIGRFPPLR